MAPRSGYQPYALDGATRRRRPDNALLFLVPLQHRLLRLGAVLQQPGIDRLQNHDRIVPADGDAVLAGNLFDQFVYWINHYKTAAVRTTDLSRALAAGAT